MSARRAVNILHKLPTKTLQRPRNRYESTQSRCQAKEKWDLMGAVYLERKPILSRPLNEIESTFKKMLLQVEMEYSMRSDHEMRDIADQKRAEELKKGSASLEELDKSMGQTAREFEDVSKNELLAFVPAERTTEADKSNDTKSPERALDRPLAFVINEKLGDDELWILPHGLRKGDETMRQTAERVLKEKCGTEVKARFYGNAPCGFYSYKYPADIRKQSDVIGAKIFFFKAQYLSGNVKTDAQKFQWLTQDELKVNLKDLYYKNIRLFTIDDELSEERLKSAKFSL